MIIAGVVIDIDPSRAESVRTRLARRRGVTRLEGPVTPGRLVAVVEAADDPSMDRLLSQVLAVPGVWNVNPAYIHFDA